MSFEGLKAKKELIEILEKHSITEPTKIQTLTFPSASNGHDVIGVSKTGSGKTIAFLLPILHQILLSNKPFHCLILVPTRELALQISETLRLFDSLGIRYSTLLGGDSFNSQVNSVNKKPHIVIGTPGRITMHIEKNKNFKIERIRKLIFDEADRFFDLDFANDLEIIKKKLIKLNQVLMFTATLTKKTKNMANLFMRSPKVYGEDEEMVVHKIKELMIVVPEKYKLVQLYNYLKLKDEQIMIFVGLCSNAQKIGLTLSKLDISCGILHGKMNQVKRETVLNAFRNGEINVLVCTDVASRGIDIPNIGIVINYDIPDCAKIYTHRIGRTGRAEKDGLAITFVCQYDIELIQKIEHVSKRKLEPLQIKDYSNFEKIKQIYEDVNADFNSNNDLKLSK